jgi:translation initiation factor eIF-2B subunit epsilon
MSLRRGGTQLHPFLFSVGDALREIQSQSIIHSDFIIVNADTICNINLQQALNFHSERRQQNRSNIMTSIVRQRSNANGNLVAEEDFYLHTIDGSGQLLQLDNMSQKTNIRFNNERIKMEKGQSLNPVVHSDLVDCEIYICAYDVLKAFQENFELHVILNSLS